MNTFFMAVKNLQKNFSFYSLYFISVAFVITVFFAFTSFSVNTVMLEKISADGRVETMCTVISVFLMIFVLFYMTYSNRFFLRRRTRELGIYALIGYRKATILSLLTFENILVCFGASLVGIILGAFAHKGIVFLISELLNLGIDNSQIQLFNLSAIIKSGTFVLVVILILVISNNLFLHKTSLINLVRYEKKAEKKMKFHKIPAILGFIMMLAGYFLASNILAGSQSLWITVGFYEMGLLTMFLIVLGTVLFIASFLPFLLQMSKRKKTRFYTSTKIIMTSNFIYRIRSNAKTLIMLTLLSAGVLTISSVMAISLYYPIAAVARIAPSEIEFRLENNVHMEDIENIISNYGINSNDISLLTTNIYKVKASSDNLPIEYSLGASDDRQNNGAMREAGFECISLSQYKALLKAQSKTKVLQKLTSLNDDEVILMKYQPSNNAKEIGNQYTLSFNGLEKCVTVKETSLNNAISFANSIGTLIVSDNLYLNIASAEQPLSTIISLNGNSIKNNENLYADLSSYLNDSPYLLGNSHRINEIIFLSSSTFLLIGFLVVLFFIAVGSILYFNNISSIMESKSDYEILGKLGYTQKKLRKIIRKQVLTFFSIPFLLGLIDCIFATIVYKIGLMQDILENSLSQYLPVAIAIIITFIIYGIYYFVTVKVCYKIALKQ
ncbi:TPA: ABC transporter permease [Clostridioides difficile]|uniref:ABC transporter permease n=1 Tax=Clostridioides difficile TaxID=1496 RepID=UPI000BB19177|nr:FtsX-like permease family protein [Clostridioides difficile]PBH03150.1 ABC transporter permease [Clostridioides difficile]VHY64006.1 salivaricin lantibiotic ABC transporter permease [Clostridioides difficile]VHY66695.1 salivaricin lantibiotic ABC transporter permease [Clostridioides difficile]HEK8913960.1 ABC transporter permease [Clostridioides difficile]